MAKEVRKGSMSHRMLDVDQYDEERYVEAAEIQDNSSALSERQSRARHLISTYPYQNIFF